MATVTISDYVIWAKHVHGDRELVDRILAMWAGQTIELEVDGFVGPWRKMDDGADGRPTPGIRPIGRVQDHWRRLFRERRGDVVELRLAAATHGFEEAGVVDRRAKLVAKPLGRTQAERDAALAALLDLGRHGYKSDRPYGPRDELYDRE